MSKVIGYTNSKGGLFPVKKKLLWEGSSTATNNYPITLSLNDDVNIGETVEVEWSLTATVSGLERTVYGTSTARVGKYEDISYASNGEILSRGTLCFSIVCTGDFSISTNTLSIEGWIPNASQMTFYRNMKYDGTGSWYPTITKIYKIIG